MFSNPGVRFVGGGVATGVIAWVVGKVLDHVFAPATQPATTAPIQAPTAPWDYTISFPLWVGVVAIIGGLIAALWPEIRRRAQSAQRAFAARYLEPPDLFTQVMKLASRLRVLADAFDADTSPGSIPADVARWERLQPRYWAIKRRLEQFFGVNNHLMRELTMIIPTGSAEYRKMAELLGRLANDVPATLRSVRIPRSENSDGI